MMLRFCALLLLIALLAADAAPPVRKTLQAAYEAEQAGDLIRAEQLLRQASTQTTDPGLVAFNLATVQFALGNYREAELNFLRSLDDREIPSARRARALYNRGVCLVKRGGDAKLFSVAVASFIDCLDTPNLDPQLADDARYNLELSKLLWLEARAREAEPPTPNEAIPENPPPQESQTTEVEEPQIPGGDSGDTQGSNRQPANGSMNRMSTTPTGPSTENAAKPSPGAGTLPVLLDEADVQSLSPTDTRELLNRAATRLRNSRLQNEQMRAGPERPNVRDW